jgi:hypothetical protein
MTYLARTTPLGLAPLGTVKLDCVAGLARLLAEKCLSPTASLIATGLPGVSFLPQSAICHLSHLAFWEYNIPQKHNLAPHVAAGVRLKFQSGTPPRPA